MHLFLANNTKVWDTIFRREDDQPAYRTVETIKNTHANQSTVDVFKIPPGQGITVKPDQAWVNEYKLAEDESLRRVEIIDLARIRIRAIHPDELTINGKLFKANAFYTKKHMRTYGRDRIWTGPDGREYRWKMGDDYCTMYLNDEAKTVVAKHHPEQTGDDPKPGSLEIIGPTTEELIDLIVITFVHMEKLRAEREQDAYEPYGGKGSMFHLRVEELGTIKIQDLAPDEYNIRQKTITTKEFYKKEGFALFYGRDRVWTGPDGRQYRWKQSSVKPELYLNDGTETMVAKYHREHSGFLGLHEACPASLEIFGPTTPELIDWILITFIHLERLRADTEDEVNDINKANLKNNIKNLGS
ncbi:hypothetical protein H1R20_g2496, partial [Candolleomyces eurysporus]